MLCWRVVLTEQNGIGISYLRISIGASDLDAEVFSYDDLPAGETDVNLDHFSLDPDRVNLIPVLKEIVALNPNIKIMPPWSAPKWMKSNNAVKGGSLKRNTTAYAKYFVKYIRGWRWGNYHRCDNNSERAWTSGKYTQHDDDQRSAKWVYQIAPWACISGDRNHNKIILFDHNCDNQDIRLQSWTILQPRQWSMVRHSICTLGDISALTTVHNAHPDRNLYFTEQWTSGNGDFAGDLRWHVKTLIVGAPRNWSRNVLEWNLAVIRILIRIPMMEAQPLPGALTINNASGAVSRNVSYYIIAHASKLVPCRFRAGQQTIWWVICTT